MDVVDAKAERDLMQRHRWHVYCFVSIGFGREQAEILELAHVDWREADDLLARGCPPETAMLILI